jgi:hypothetical protein
LAYGKIAEECDLIRLVYLLHMAITTPLNIGLMAAYEAARVSNNEVEK